MLSLRAQAVSKTEFTSQKYIFSSGKNFDYSKTIDEYNLHIIGIFFIIRQKTYL